ncbi:MAG: hypothetical protein G3M78_10790 [Candidatus Nitrohelix vancouverensis]|uniref:ABM domain-containing protein n=1 Tax=Candidatus Nitrohelix vancouverensis TaxID=2705534 RepID=A0A7T0G415_9BACT|nr:MAG: hypothetical protein G3M78_10790 [Candidatus Nitrohelix vancouverensis]
MAIYMSARFRVHRHAIKKCKEAMVELVDYVRANEPRTLVYLAQQEISDPTRFMSILIFENETGLALHRNSPASKKFAETVYPEALEPVEFSEYNVVADRNQ